MPRFKTLAHGLAQPGDNFLLLRFLAAALVIYGHAPAISGGPASQDIFVALGWGEYSGSIAVELFFVVSGFLVTGSFCRRGHAIDFVWARFIRIMPAYAACLLLSALVIGPLFTIHPLGSYLADDQTLAYVTRNLRFGMDAGWDLPGVFLGNPRRTTVNGSLWTLPAEVRMYAWVAMLGFIGVLRVRWLSNAALLGLFVLGFFASDQVPLIPLHAYVRLAAMFALGGFCYINRSWIPVHGGLLLAVAAAAFALHATALYSALFSACEVLFVFWFAYNTPRLGFERSGDYSYGLYLWGFPMQQIVAALFPLLPALANALLGFIAALGLAVASWHVVEKPALRLKNLPTAIAGTLRKHLTRLRGTRAQS